MTLKHELSEVVDGTTVVFNEGSQKIEAPGIGVVVVGGDPSVGQTLVAVSGTQVEWATPATGGSLPIDSTVITANATLAANIIHQVDCSGGDVTITIDSVSDDDRFALKLVGGSGDVSQVLVAPTGAGLIETPADSNGADTQASLRFCGTYAEWIFDSEATPSGVWKLVQYDRGTGSAEAPTPRDLASAVGTFDGGFTTISGVAHTGQALVGISDNAAEWGDAGGLPPWGVVITANGNVDAGFIYEVASSASPITVIVNAPGSSDTKTFAVKVVGTSDTNSVSINFDGLVYEDPYSGDIASSEVVLKVVGTYIEYFLGDDDIWRIKRMGWGRGTFPSLPRPDVASGLQVGGYGVDAGIVVIRNSDAPEVNQILVAESDTNAVWANNCAQFIGDPSDAVEIAFATGTPGQVLTLVDANTTAWADAAAGGVTSTGSITADHLVSYDDTSGDVIEDSGIAKSDVRLISTMGSGVNTFLTTPTSANLAAALTDETGSGAAVFATSPTLVTPALGTPSAVVLTNATGLPLAAVTGLGTGVATFLGTPSSANLAAALTDETGTGANVFATSPTLVTPVLGTPASATLTNATGLPISTGVSGLGSGVATALAAGKTGTGNIVLDTSPTLTTPALGTPSALVLTNATGTPAAIGLANGTGLPISTGVSGLGSGVATFLATPSSANLAAALTDETGSGANVFATSPTLVTPALGTPSALVLTNATGTPSSIGLANGTGLPISTGVSGLGTNVAAFLATPSSANLAAALTDETGTGAVVLATSPTLVTPALGTPSAATLTNATGLPISTGVSGLGSGVATFLATPSSANLAAALTDETGSGAAVFATSPTLVTPALGTPSALVLTNATGRASSSQTADQIATSGTAVTISSTAPSAGKVLQASSSTAAAWTTPISTAVRYAQATVTWFVNSATASLNTLHFAPITGGGGNRTLVLPAGHVAGDKIMVSVTSVGGYDTDTITIDPNSSETIDGSTTKVFKFLSVGQLLTLVSNGSNWITEYNTPLYSDAFNLFMQTGSSVELAAFVTDGTGSGALVFGTSPTINVAAGGSIRLSAASNRLVSSGSAFAGSAAIQDSGIDVAKVMAFTLSSISADTTAAVSTLYLVDSTSGVITVTLPAVASSTSKWIFVKRKTGSNNVVLDGNASETIDGATTLTLSVANQSTRIYCDGSAWYTI